MSKSKGARESEQGSPSRSHGPDPVPGFVNRIPARLWLPAGFVGFFFILGAWNQISSSWDNPSGPPASGSGPGLGLLAGSVALVLCLLMGLRAWRQEGRARRLSDDIESDWRDELKEHNEDIRFP